MAGALRFAYMWRGPSRHTHDWTGYVLSIPWSSLVHPASIPRTGNMDADEQWRLAQGLRFCAALLSASAVLVDGVVATPHVGGLGEELLADLRKASRHLHAGVDEARALMPCLQNFAHATMIRKGVRSTRNSSSGALLR